MKYWLIGRGDLRRRVHSELRQHKEHPHAQVLAKRNKKKSSGRARKLAGLNTKSIFSITPTCFPNSPLSKRGSTISYPAQSRIKVMRLPSRRSGKNLRSVRREAFLIISRPWKRRATLKELGNGPL